MGEDPTCMCGVAESEHGTADPPHAFVPQADLSAGCCAACSGRGSNHSGPCSDCYGTGHAHPDSERCH